MDSGVFLEKTRRGALVEGNRIEGNLFGIYVHGAADAVVRGNKIIGPAATGACNEAGNGVSVWNAPGAKVARQRLPLRPRRHLLTVSQRKDVFSGNRFRDLRFAVHYMYTNDSEVSGNVSIGNHVGYAIMYSHRLIVRGNVSDGDRDHGLLFNFANGSQINGNSGGGLARLDNAGPGRDARQRTRERGMPAGANAAAARRPQRPRRNASSSTTPTRTASATTGSRAARSACISPPGRRATRSPATPSSATATRSSMSAPATSTGRKDGRGNYWSDNPAFDLNGDGIADTAYRPNDLVDRVLWTAPQAKVLINSPAVQVIRWAQAQFPALLSRRRRGQPSADGAAADATQQPEASHEPVPSPSTRRRQALRRGGGGARRLVRPRSEGETVALVGHNGAGKTTLIKLMLGLIRADARQHPGARRRSGRRAIRRPAGGSAICRRTSPSTRP